MFGRNHSFRSPVYGNGAYLSPPAMAPTPVKRKVVSVPVQFVQSDDKKAPAVASADGDAAAIKIQKAFRGFVVRKNVRIVRKIEAEVDEIELKFRADLGMDRIVREEKERLAINEMLMRLLFRLDSVRGVRDYRRRVIRRVIALQEMVDSISAARSDDQTLESAAVEDVETLETADEVVENSELEEEVVALSAADDVSEESKARDAKVTEESKTIEGDDPMEVSHQDDDKRDLKVEEVETPGAGDQISTGWELLEEKEEISDSRQGSSKVEEASIGGSDSAARASESGSKEGRMTAVMERMVAENEKLKGLVAELCERSAQQCRLMGGLAERVEHLEKIVEKMERRKKKRKDSSCSPAGSLDKKCGRD